MVRKKQEGEIVIRDHYSPEDYPDWDCRAAFSVMCEECTKHHHCKLSPVPYDGLEGLRDRMQVWLEKPKNRLLLGRYMVSETACFWMKNLGFSTKCTILHHNPKVLVSSSFDEGLDLGDEL